MNFFEKVTGNDMKIELKAYDQRIKQLPVDYQKGWEAIKMELWNYSDFSGRNLMPILGGIVGLLEESSAENLPLQAVLDEDIHSFCSAIAGEEGAWSYQDKWRDQLNKNVAKKLSQGGHLK